MPCQSPLSIQTKFGPIQVNCKQCLNCRISRQSALTLKCLMEFQTTLSAEFWTLTYADAPEKGGYQDISNFLRRYRRWNQKQGNNVPIRYLACGEYGNKSGRFHYHCLLYNGVARPSNLSLTKLWPHGFVHIGSVTPASIRYTARYTLKFAAKGQEAVANWSKNPPLGSDGIRQLATYMRNRGDKLENNQIPTYLTIEKSSYTIDKTLRTQFGKAFYQDEKFELPSNGAGAHLKYLTEMKLGDPVAAQTKRQEEKNYFWETVKLSNETL